MTNTFSPSTCCLGIELGSTRIKACLVDERFSPIASGGFAWESKYENGYFTYDLEDVHHGLQVCYAQLKKSIEEAGGAMPTSFAAMGISGMMHGYLAFDADGHLLTPFRTWRNTTTEAAATELTRLFGFNVPLRWSISHLYQAILNGETHVGQIAHITTLSGYVYYRLTGRWEVGMCEASGIFPVDADGSHYHPEMLEKFNELLTQRGHDFRVEDILPSIRPCGDTSATLTEAGARLLDSHGDLQAGVIICPPEGDGGTGMVATNSVRPHTGNVSAGTSVFSMLVLDRPLRGVYPEIDVVSTPAGHPVAMVHGNNGCSELDLWINLFGEFAGEIGGGLDVVHRNVYGCLQAEFEHTHNVYYAHSILDDVVSRFERLLQIESLGI